MQLRKSLLALAVMSPLIAADGPSAGGPFIVHEWGTFTTVAGNDGNPVPWQPLDGPTDLPCFVHRGPVGKVNLTWRVRMETPVLYFYAQRLTTVSVHVRLLHGLLTEWYPQTSRPAGSSLDWESVEVSPGADPSYPIENAASHYYAARATDASPLRIGGEQEKLIFYRGIGDFPIPLCVSVLSDRELALSNMGTDPVPLAILFENRGGKMGYRIAREVQETLRLETPDLSASVDALRGEMEQALIGLGLYPKEARAMLETWRDSWFEEGTRVFYAVPRTVTDAVLPLSVDPSPAGIARVFIGRIEVLSPWMETGIRRALADDNSAQLAKWGRFLRPFLEQMEQRSGRLPRAAATRALLQRQPAASRCAP